MQEVPRLNGVIRALEQGTPAFVTFAPAEFTTLQAIGAAPYDGVVLEMEHGPYNTSVLRDSLYYLLDRRQIAEAGSVAPAVTPMVRIPPNGKELNQWIAKQVLDMGVYGIVWPHICTVEEARNAVAACRYSRPTHHPLFEPAGQRGDGGLGAPRYWGLTRQEYYARADVWPLNPMGEILVIIMIESTRGIENLDEILSEVKGIGAVLIGEGDLSQDVGFPRQYDHPEVLSAVSRVLETCKRNGVPCGIPHVDKKRVGPLMEQGFRLLMTPLERRFDALQTGRQAAGRNG